MENKFEGLSDRLLFKIISKIYYDFKEDHNEIFDSSTLDYKKIDTIEDSLKPFGFKINRIIETEYIFEVIRLNLQYIKIGSLDGELKRPQLIEYEFDTDVTETVYQTVTWRNTVSSYSNPYYLIKSIDYYGDFEYYEGREIDNNIFDSSTDSIKIDRNSFREI